VGGEFDARMVAVEHPRMGGLCGPWNERPYLIHRTEENDNLLPGRKGEPGCLNMQKMRLEILPQPKPRLPKKTWAQPKRPMLKH